MANWAIFKIVKIFHYPSLMRMHGGAVVAIKVRKKKKAANVKPAAKKAARASLAPKASKAHFFTFSAAFVQKLRAAKFVVRIFPRIPNAATQKVLLDARAGKNLVRYGSAEEMYEDLGI